MADQRHREINESELQGFKYFRLLQPFLERLHPLGTERDRAGNRDLFADHYVSLLLLYFFNGIVTSLRGLQQASGLRKVQRLLGIPRTSLGSLSEAARVFDAEALHEILIELAGQAVPLKRGREAEALKGLTAGDGTVLKALPKMVWALWQDDEHRAAKLHLQFDVIKGVPVDGVITPAASSEPGELQAMLQPNRLYVLDRGYAGYPFMASICDAGSSFIVRVQDTVAYSVMEERPLSEEARQAGVIRDVIIDRLGTSHHKNHFPDRLLRLVVVQRIKPDKTIEYLYLVTDRLDLPAELVALAYRYRWTIELFFRWFKCVLGCRHLISTAENGVQLQVYAALIASLLITLWTGRKPTKRTFELLQFYMIGWAELDEVEAHLARLKKIDS
jgi:hypothetical protein